MIVFLGRVDCVVLFLSDRADRRNVLVHLHPSASRSCGLFRFFRLDGFALADTVNIVLLRLSAPPELLPKLVLGYTLGTICLWIVCVVIFQDITLSFLTPR